VNSPGDPRDAPSARARILHQCQELPPIALEMMPEPERGSRDLISFGWSPQRLARVLNVTDPESIAESAVWGVLLAERERGGREADKSDESPSS
jgi:hypothetical protein